MTDVIYIPEARCNLFSISKIESTGMKVVFEESKVEILHDSVVVATGQRNEKLYVLNFYPPQGERDSIFFSGKICKATELWHRRYGKEPDESAEKWNGERLEGLRRG